LAGKVVGRPFRRSHARESMARVAVGRTHGLATVAALIVDC